MKTCWGILAIGLLVCSVANAQSLDKPALLHDRWVLMLAGIQTGAQTYDGITTRQAEKVAVYGQTYQCSTTCSYIRGTFEYTETDPISRVLLGPRPTWSRMAPIGAAQVLGSAVLAHYIHNRHSWVRHFWWVPQVTEISLSVIYGSRNLDSSRTRAEQKCEDSGYTFCR